MPLKTEMVELKVPGEAKPMAGYLAVPEEPGPHAAVIVIEEIFGVNSHIRDVTERIARLGYEALAPDIHHRSAPGIELGYDAEGTHRGMQLIPKLTEKGALADVNGSIAFLRERPTVRRDRIGCIGFCIGGHVAYLAACATDVRATASFYGGGIAVFGLGGGPATVTKTGGIRGKILCLFGKQDSSIPAEQVEAIRRALEQHRVRHEIQVYDDAGHAFFCDQRAGYNPRAAADAWQRVQRLFAEELGR